MKAEKIIDSLKFTFEEADEQKDLLHRPTFSINAALSTQQITAVILLIISVTHPQPMNRRKRLFILSFSDSSCVESCADEADFLEEFGYIDGGADQIRKGLKAFRACKRTKKAIERLFTADEIETLQAHFENY